MTIPIQDGDASQVERVTYDPDDNKLRIYSGRVSRELYDFLCGRGGQGWNRAYKQGCFFATWTPVREDAALALLEAAGLEDIEDEDTTLTTEDTEILLAGLMQAIGRLVRVEFVMKFLGYR